MQTLIRNYSAGSVASVNADGTPSVSPKATFVILNDTTLAYGDIRSPGKTRNLKESPAVEVCFTDVLERKALRVTGTGKVIDKADAAPEVLHAFIEFWPDYVTYMSSFVMINVSAVQLIFSPAYDVGFSAEELKEANLLRLKEM